MRLSGLAVLFVVLLSIGGCGPLVELNDLRAQLQQADQARQEAEQQVEELQAQLHRLNDQLTDVISERDQYIERLKGLGKVVPPDLFKRDSGNE